jgi:hypothetical protein
VRNMSFSLTTEQMRRRTKDVTRRCAWWKLRAGDRVMAVEKGMGLKAGEKAVRIHAIEILSVRPERLDKMLTELTYGMDEVRREGFPEMSPLEFVTMFCATHDTRKARGATIVNRIEFRHL